MQTEGSAVGAESIGDSPERLRWWPAVRGDHPHWQQLASVFSATGTRGRRPPRNFDEKGFSRPCIPFPNNGTVVSGDKGPDRTLGAPPITNPDERQTAPRLLRLLACRTSRPLHPPPFGALRTHVLSRLHRHGGTGESGRCKMRCVYVSMGGRAWARAWRGHQR